ncbi:hypothetical protein Nepgr_004085 [Nepenthes gracilis]|uniref:catalase n=1 Tax=Nepenthes gracilis TaxID=150966 RepID=A0AAD3S0P3_NEPGR|nr:hypothetical protein Nepgr_004085 [Nepenthes gracilis]
MTEQVHAGGASANGFFEVMQDVSYLPCVDYQRAFCFWTPMIVRFSTVLHERGSLETLRDPRGFVVQFYIREGNFDMFMATDPFTRPPFLRAQMVFYLFLFLRTMSTEKPFAYLRLNSLGVVVALLKLEDQR